MIRLHLFTVWVLVAGLQGLTFAQEVPTTTPTSPLSSPPNPPPPPPSVNSHGITTGEVWIGHRTVIDRYAGWGWIWREDQTHRRAKWVVLEEVPGKFMAPGRFLSNPDMDNNVQYKLYGEWANYKAYEPNYDVMVSVFKIKGWERIGPAELPAKLVPPRAQGPTRFRTSERAARN
jgi:hypothetical protein